MKVSNVVYNNIYNYILSIIELNEFEYNNLVCIYGKKVVDCVIENIILKNENDLDKFSYFIENIIFDVDDVVSSNLDIYMNEIGLSKQLSRKENQKYSNEAYEIVNELNKLFKIVSDVEYVNQDGILFNSILDQIDFYLEKCTDSNLYKKIVDLKDRYIVVRDILVNGNLMLVVSILKKKYLDSVSFNDIIQNGNVALMRAVEKYNPNFKTTFVNYAYYWIKQSLRFSVKNDITGCMNISYKSIDDNNIKIRVINDLTLKLGRIPTDYEICSCMGISLDRLNELNSIFEDVISLYSNVSNYALDENSAMLIDTIEDRSINVCDDVCFKIGRDELINYLRNNLSEKQVQILLHRFGFYGDEKNIAEIGRLFGMSRQGADLSYKRALSKLRRLSKIEIKEYFNI